MDGIDSACFEFHKIDEECETEDENVTVLETGSLVTLSYYTFFGFQFEITGIEPSGDWDNPDLVDESLRVTDDTPWSNEERR